MDELLRVSNLRTWFESQGRAIRAVDGVDFALGESRTLGIVGESGSGKSVTALSIMRLIDAPGRIQEGSSIRFEGRELTALTEHELESIRGAEISMVFQEPMTSLNPVYTVGDQIAESVQHPPPCERSRPRGRVRSRCSSSSASRRPLGGSTTTRISSRAACGSA